MKNTTFVLQNMIDKSYWYGFYTNKTWTDDIREAKTQDEEYFTELMAYNPEPFEGMILTTVKIYK